MGLYSSHLLDVHGPVDQPEDLQQVHAPNHKVGSGMHKWDYAFFNLMLAGLFTFQ